MTTSLRNYTTQANGNEAARRQSHYADGMGCLVLTVIGSSIAYSIAQSLAAIGEVVKEM